MIKDLFTFILILYSYSYSQQILTPLEKNNYSSITTYNELTDFVYELERTSELLNVEILGNSIEGKNLYVLKYSKSEFGRDKNKIKILIFAQQHGNEQSGKEGALLLAGELLKEEYEYLFDRIDLAIIPQMNPDGSEKNKRRNGNDMDLNRNHLILTEPETIALHKLFNQYLFEVTMDVHEYAPYGESWKNYGYRFNNDEEVGTLTNINISSEIIKLQKKEYLPFIKKYFTDRGFSFFEYSPGGPPEIDYIRHSTFDINDGRQSLGIQNTFSFIQEGLNGKDIFLDNIEHRAKGQMTGMLGLLEFAYNHRDEIKNLISDARKKLIENKVSETVSIQLDHFSDGSKLELPLLSYYSNTDTIVTVKDYRPIVESIYDVKRPLGYLIPKSMTDLIEWANKHNLKYYDYKWETSHKIEQYFIVEIDSIDFERDTIINPIVEVKEVSANILDEEYFYIPVNQLKNNMIVIALEPKSMLGLVTYKQFSYLIEAGKNYPILRVVNNK